VGLDAGPNQEHGGAERAQQALMARASEQIDPEPPEIDREMPR